MPHKFALDLSKFKMKSTDGKSSTLEHRDGHMVTIAHAPLSLKLRKQLDQMAEKMPKTKMADGGKVADKPDASLLEKIGKPFGDVKQDPAPSPAPQHFADGTPDNPVQVLKEYAAERDAQAPTEPAETAGPQMPEAQDAPQSSASQVDPALAQKRDFYNQQASIRYPNQKENLFNGEAGPSKFDRDIWQNAEQNYNYINEKKQATAAADVAAKQQNMAEDNKARQAAGLPPVAESTGPALASSGQEDPQQPQAGEEPQMQAQPAPQKPAREPGQSAEAQGGASAAPNKKFDVQQEIQHLSEDIKNNKIDPPSLFKGMNFGQKVLASLSLVVGGIGSGILHQPNQALSILQQHMQNDIESQIKNKDQQNTLLGHLIQAGAKPAEIAHLAAQTALMQAQAKREQMMNSYMGQGLGGATGNAGTPMAMDPETAFRQKVQATRFINPGMAKDMEERHLSGIGDASVPLSEKARTEIVSRNTLQDAISNLRQWAKTHSGSLDPATVNYGRALASQVQDAYRQANGQGVFKESEKNFVQGIIDDDPTKFMNKLRVDPKYKALEDVNLSVLNGIHKAYGLPPRAATPQFKIVGGVKYMRGPNGEAVRVK